MFGLQNGGDRFQLAPYDIPWEMRPDRAREPHVLDIGGPGAYQIGTGPEVLDNPEYAMWRDSPVAQSAAAAAGGMWDDWLSNAAYRADLHMAQNKGARVGTPAQVQQVVDALGVTEQQAIALINGAVAQHMGDTDLRVLLPENRRNLAPQTSHDINDAVQDVIDRHVVPLGQQLQAQIQGPPQQITGRSSTEQRAQGLDALGYEHILDRNRQVGHADTERWAAEVMMGRGDRAASLEGELAQRGLTAQDRQLQQLDAGSGLMLDHTQSLQRSMVDGSDPSQAGLMLQEGQERALRDNLSLARSGPGANPLAMYQAQQQAGGMSQQAARDAALLRAGEQQQLRGEIAQGLQATGGLRDLEHSAYLAGIGANDAREMGLFGASAQAGQTSQGYMAARQNAQAAAQGYEGLGLQSTAQGMGAMQQAQGFRMNETEMRARQQEMAQDAWLRQRGQDLGVSEADRDRAFQQRNIDAQRRAQQEAALWQAGGTLVAAGTTLYTANPAAGAAAGAGFSQAGQAATGTGTGR